jgi:hypothetical protein
LGEYFKSDVGLGRTRIDPERLKGNMFAQDISYGRAKEGDEGIRCRRGRRGAKGRLKNNVREFERINVVESSGDLDSKGWTIMDRYRNVSVDSVVVRDERNGPFRWRKKGMVCFCYEQINGMAYGMCGEGDELEEVKRREEVSECARVSWRIKVNVEVSKYE